MSGSASSDPLQRVVTWLEGHGYATRYSHRNGQYRCPVHDDTEPSLSVSVLTSTTARDPKFVGAVMVNCYAGCERDAVLDAMGLTLFDLFPNPCYKRNVSTALLLRISSAYVSSNTVSWSKPLPNFAELEKRHARGDLKPARVVLGPMPGDSTGDMVKLQRSFMFVRGLYEAAGEYRPIPFSARWAAKRNGLTPMRVSRGLRRLVAAGVVIHCGSLPPKDGKPLGAKVYEPPLFTPDGAIQGAEPIEVPAVEHPLEVVYQSLVDGAEPAGGEVAVRVATGDGALAANSPTAIGAGAALNVVGHALNHNATR